MTTLEAQMVQLREEWQVVQQTPLIQARLLNALRETQLEHSRRLDGIDTRLDGIDTRLDGIDTRLDGIDTRLDGHDRKFEILTQGQETIISMLTTLIDAEPSAGG